MADPVTIMAGVGMASTVVGGVISGIGNKFSSDATANAYRYKAGIATLNQTIAKQNAAWAVNAGGVKAANFGLKAGQEIGQTKAVQGASGLDVNTGSAEAVRESQTDVAKYDQGMIRADAAHTAYGYDVEAAKYGAEASMDTSAAANQDTAGQLGVLSSIIGTVGSVASKWTQGSMIGIGSGGGGFQGQMVTGGPSGPGTFSP